MDMNVAGKQALHRRVAALRRRGWGIRGRVTILIGLGIDRQAAEGAFRQAVALAGEAVACGADTLFDTPPVACLFCRCGWTVVVCHRPLP
jgi:hypothetical protein